MAGGFKRSGRFGLIGVVVVAIYLFESFVPLLIGGPLIAIAAAYGSVRALGPGGELDAGYERVGVAMAPRWGSR